MIMLSDTLDQLGQHLHTRSDRLRDQSAILREQSQLLRDSSQALRGQRRVLLQRLATLIVQQRRIQERLTAALAASGLPM